MSRSRLIRLSLLAALVAVVLGAYFVATSAAKGPHVTITGNSIANYKFKPRKLTVSKGTTVHWHWSSNEPHNVTFSAKKHSSTGATGSYKLRFKKPGTYKYVCTVHGFTGKVVVTK